MCECLYGKWYFLNLLNTNMKLGTQRYIYFNAIDKKTNIKKKTPKKRVEMGVKISIGDFKRVM